MEESNALPILIDIVSIGNSLEKLEEDIKKIKPQIMIDLVVDNSLDGNSTNLNISNEEKRKKRDMSS